MKLSTAIVFSFLSSALAAGPADNVNAVLKDIGDALRSFDTTIKAYTGGPAVDALNKASAKVEDITSKGAKSIAAGADLTLNDAVSITTNVQGLQTVLDSTLKDLEGVGPQLASAGQCSSITAQLTSQNAAAKALEAAITAKAPNETKGIAKQLGGQVGASISATQSKFTTICANAPKGAPPAGGSTGGAAGGSSGGSKTGAGSATSSTAPKPAVFPGSANSLSACRGLALGVAAAFLAM
jgi:hypothetical protein